MHTPLDALPITGRPPERSWTALCASLLAHVGLAVLIFLLSRPAQPPAPKRAGDGRPTPVREEQTVYLPPFPTRELPKPRPTPPPRPVERQRRVPLPQVARGPENIPEDPPTPQPPVPTPPSPLPSVTTPSKADAPGPPAPTEVASAATAFEAETQRLFGPRMPPPGSGGGAVPQVRWNNGPTEDRENECKPRPQPPRRPGEPIALEFVEGVVYNDITHVPLGGAHLQIMGTQYVTFADDAGHYRLGFDPALVDECRSQYVRVIARGIPPQLIVLGRGAGGTNIYLRP
jgi:hypothetical protein